MFVLKFRFESGRSESSFFTATKLQNLLFLQKEKWIFLPFFTNLCYICYLGAAVLWLIICEYGNKDVPLRLTKH